MLLVTMAAATILVLMLMPRLYRSDASVSVEWLTTQAHVPAEITADILRQRLAHQVEAGDDRITVAPEPGTSLFVVSLDDRDRYVSGTRLGKVLDGVADNPASRMRRGALANDLAAADREVGEFSSALALVRATINTAQVPTPPVLGQGTQAEAQQELTDAIGLETASKANVATLAGARDAARQDLEALEERYGPLHPVIAEDRARLDAASTALTAATSDLATVRAHVRKAKARLHRARDAVPPATATPGNPQVTLLIAKLKAAIAAAQARRVALFDQMKALAPPFPYVVRVERAVTPQRHGRPSTPLILLIALAATSAATGLLLFVHEMQAKGFRSVRAIEAAFGTKVVALVPETGGGRRSGSSDPADLILGDGGSLLLSSLRDALSSLSLRPNGGLTVAICSAIPAEGKTTTALCLARASALSGVRTVVVDCDGRRAILSKSLPGRSTAGLVQVLDDQSSLSDAIEQDVSGSHFLRHSADTSFRDLSDAKLMAPVLAELAARFELVLLDTAPVLGLAETRILASLTDRVLFVLRWRVTPRGASRRALTTLSYANADIAGIIATRVVRARPLFSKWTER